MKTFLLKGIPEDVLRNFKAACAAKGKTMKDILIQFMITFAKK
jgi:hypothetical protein